MLVGRDQEGIGAAARYIEEPGSSYFFVSSAAVANRWRGEGVGDELVEQVLEAITQRALEHSVSTVTVEAKVHRDNKPSLRLVKRWDFQEQFRDGDLLAFAGQLYLG